MLRINVLMSKFFTLGVECPGIKFSAESMPPPGATEDLHVQAASTATKHLATAIIPRLYHLCPRHDPIL